MSDTIPTPAFPVQGFEDDPSMNGMDLRDYFAAKAMQALIAKEDKEPGNRGGKAVPIISQFAYEYADAMLKERGK